MQLNSRGEPIYSPRDVPELSKIRDLGLPFYLAGGYADPEKLDEALQAGASGVQIGTAFAFCEESGIDSDLKSRVIEASRAGNAHVMTDPSASPTGFPFKVLQLEGTLSDPQVLRPRKRVCDLGYLRQPYRKPDGTVGYRCPGEPVEQYLAKGGDIADTAGKMCVCNSLCATVGFAQRDTEGHVEPPLITAGDDVARLTRFISDDNSTYTAADVLNFVLNPAEEVHHGTA